MVVGHRSTLKEAVVVTNSKETAQRGFIEGWYGASMLPGDRMRLLQVLGDLGLNTYLYAPKADAGHRQLWWQERDRDWRDETRSLAEQAASRGVVLAVGLSPIRTDVEGYQSTVVERCRELLDCGVQVIAMLYDDIEDDVEAVDAALAESQARVVSGILDSLSDRLSPSSLWFCPTEYSSELIQDGQDGIAASHYLKALARRLPSGVPLFWTGPTVVSTEIDSAELSELKAMFGTNPLIWDNFYATDWCPRRLVLCPYTGREHGTNLLINGCGKPLTDTCHLHQLSLVCQGTPPAEAFMRAIHGLQLPEGWEALLPLCQFPKTAKPLSATQRTEALQWLRGHVATPHPWLVENYSELAAMRHDLEQGGDPLHSGSQSYLRRQPLTIWPAD